MIIFLYGPDDWRREQKKRSIVADFKNKYSAFGLGFFDFLKEDELVKFQEFARGQSIFGGLKLAVLENIFLEESKEGMARELKNLLSDKNTNILVSEKEEPPKVLDFLAKKPVLSQRFDYLRGRDWASFIKSKAKEFGVSLTDSALELLAQIYQGNTWGLVTELEKISLLKSGIVDRKNLESVDLEARPDFWLLLDALRGYDISRRFIALERVFAQNEPLPKIFNILASQWRFDGAHREREKIPQFAEYDLMVKSGKLDYEEALLDLVIS